MRTLFAPLLPALLGAAIGLAASLAPAQEAGPAEIREMALGAEDAPVTVIEYASFTCPHCATFHETVYPRLKENYIDTGQVRFITREVYFDRYGLWASMVARCGEGERFYGIADQIYDRQSQWTQGDDAAAVAGNLRRIGLSAGLTAEQLDTCLSDADKAQALVDWYQANAERDGIQGTPSFLIDGELHSNMSYADFSELLDARLGDEG